MNAERILMVLKQPHTSEKATVMAEKFNQYTFKVLNSATKPEIKMAVEKMFDVKVKSVSTINTKGKKKRFKQTSGQRSDWKKAFVALEPDQSIDLTSTE